MSAVPQPVVNAQNVAQTSHPSVSMLRAEVLTLAQRLREADELTNKSVKSLHTAFKILEERLQDDSEHKSQALSVEVENLNAHLTKIIRDTQVAVARDLKTAIDNPKLTVLEQAVKLAEVRISNAEAQQADALAKINKNIASLAKAVDARVEEERKAREASIGDVYGKISELETSSANAIRKLGENLVDITEGYQDRATETARDLEERISRASETAKQDIEAGRIKVERRVENLEETHRNLETYTDRKLAHLTSRIDTLEYGLKTISERAENNVQQSPVNVSAYDTNSDFQAAALPKAAPKAVPFMPSGQAHNTDADMQVAFEPPRQGQYGGIPVQPPLARGGSRLSEAHESEFSPQYYDGPNNPTGATQTDPNPYYSTATHEFEDFDTASPTSQFAVTTSEYGYEADHGDLPFSDPAYAETETATQMQRPGGLRAALPVQDTSKVVSHKNIRRFGIGVAVAAVAYVGVKSILSIGGGDSPEINETPLGVQSEISSDFVPTIAESTGRLDSRALGEDADTLAAGLEGISDEQTPLSENADGAQPQTATVETSGDLPTLKEAADRGNPIAQFQLGLSYLQEENLEQAVSYIRKAANQGQPAAQYRLGKLYELGQGVTADPVIARQLTERAARSGNRIAMHDLALYYAEGRGDVDVDVRTAASWFEKAAERGVVDSQFNLGILFESGQGIPKDLSNAYFWYKIAAGQGDQDAGARVEAIKTQLSASQQSTIEARVEDFTPSRIDDAANGIFRDTNWQMPRSSAALGMIAVDTNDL